MSGRLPRGRFTVRRPARSGCPVRLRPARRQPFGARRDIGRDCRRPEPVRRPPRLLEQGAQDEATRKRLAADLQRLGYEEVPCVSYGEYRRPWAFRNVVKGIVPSPVVALWNIWLEA